MIVIYILSAWLSIIFFMKFTHELLISLKGRRWWYRNVYLSTWNWRFSRQVKFLFYGKKCRVCGVRRGLDVHHKTYKHMWKEWMYPWELDVLCRKHHNAEHAK